MAAPSHPAGLWASAQALLAELPKLFSDRLELLALELERAARALSQIVVLLVVAAILGVTAWLAIWGVVVGGLMAAGLHWVAALLVVLLLNVAVAIGALLRMGSLLPRLALPTTRRHLSLSADPDPGPSAHAQEPVIHDRFDAPNPTAPPAAATRS